MGRTERKQQSKQAFSISFHPLNMEI